MNIYGVIMAGGGGTRFWPLSRKRTPKQLLNLDGRDTMINETIERLTPVIPRENIFIVTNKDQADAMGKVTAGRVEPDHILAEPAARNTAACIGYAASKILRQYGDGVMCVFPADHYIRDARAFGEVIRQAAKEARDTDRLITVGIRPAFASTGYGYIQYRREGDGPAYPVTRFVEKPGREDAEKYIRDGGYAWNSGMFIWKASVIMEYFRELLPEAHRCLAQISEAMGTPQEERVLEEIYPAIPKISIDYGIMEKADNVAVIEGDFGWSDVGSWDALDALHERDENGNIASGETLLIDAENTIAYGTGRLIAAVGVKDLVIVETGDAVLVCPQERAQDVKKIVEALEQKGPEYL